MSDLYDPLLDRLTRRLKIDPELCCEVRKELRTHLEDAQHDFAQGGQSETQSSQQAIRALGDEQVLEEALWSANRGRVRLRRWMRRGVLVAMLPLAILVTLWPMWESNWARISEPEPNLLLWVNHADHPNPFQQWLLTPGTQTMLRKLSPDERFLFLGDPSSTIPQERARSIRDRWPDDPVYQANYLRHIEETNPYNPPKELMWSENDEDCIKELERGEQLDPDNAFWNLIHAGIMFRYAATMVENDPAYEFRSITRDKQAERNNPSQGLVISEVNEKFASVQIHDEVRWEQAMQAFERAVKATHYDSHVMSMFNRQMNVLPQPRSMTEFTARLGWVTSIGLPNVGSYRQVIRMVASDALRRAKAGDIEGALAQLDKLERLIMRIGSKAHTIIELLATFSCEHIIHQHRGAVYQVAGNQGQVQAAFARQRAMFTEMENIKNNPAIHEEKIKAGSLMAIMMPAIGGYRPDPEPLRTAEQASVQQMLIAGILLFLDALILLFMLAGLLMLWKQRRANLHAPLLWIGWHRLGLVLGVGVLLPGVVYGVYLLTPWSGRGYGVHAIWPRLLIEHLLLLIGVLVLVIVMSWWAIRQRAMEIGMTMRRGVMLRALGPILAAVVVLTAVIGYSGSRWVERSAISRASGASALDLREEVNASNYRFIRDRMAEQARK